MRGRKQLGCIEIICEHCESSEIKSSSMGGKGQILKKKKIDEKRKEPNCKAKKQIYDSVMLQCKINIWVETMICVIKQTLL